jgi:ferredoxin
MQGLCLAAVLVGVFVAGANCERWCPFGGAEAIVPYLAAGDVLCSLGASNFFILGGVLLTVLVVRRAFCGYMCPIAAISELLAAVGRRLGLRPFRVPNRADRWLGLFKYVVLAAILIATWRVGELVFRGFDPCYALIGRHGPDITMWAYVISGVIAVASVAIALPFCRWLCPLAAVMNPFSRFGLARVKRNAEACSECGACSKRCPVAIPVHRLEQVTSARCISCMNCVAACPGSRSGTEALAWGPPRPLGHRWPQAALIAVLLFGTATAVVASQALRIPSFVRSHGARPDRVAAVELRLENLSCRGRANLLFYFLERDDMFQIPGYFKVEAWPGPGLADVRITFDPQTADAEVLKRAITEPYFDVVADYWRNSPFQIEGYDPLGFDVEFLDAVPSP